MASVVNDTVKHAAQYVSFTNRVHTVFSIYYYFLAVAATGGRVRSSVRGGEPLLRARGINDRIT